MTILYNYFNNIREGVENKINEEDWIETKKVWTISFRQLLTVIENDGKNIKKLKDNCKKYQEIYDCLKYRQTGLTEKTQQKNVSNSQNADKRKEMAKSITLQLKNILQT
jgi:hypothetical protein